MECLSHADKAEKLFREGCNCSQAVFTAFSDITGFSKEQSIKLSAGFGGGFGRMREVCGAVSGMTMALGYLFASEDVNSSTDKAALYSLISRCMNEFADSVGSYICRDILKTGSAPYSPSATVRTPSFYDVRPCAGCVRLAAEIADRVIAEKNGARND